MERYQELRPILYSFHLFGLGDEACVDYDNVLRVRIYQNPAQRRESDRKCTVRVVLIVVAIHAYLVHVIAGSVAHSVKKRDAMIFFKNLADIVHCFVSVYSLDFFIVNDKKLFALAFRIANLPTLETSTQKRRVAHFHKQFCVVITVAAWIYFLCRGCLSFFENFFNVAIESQIEEYFYNLEILNRYSWIAYIVWIVDLALFNCICNVCILQYGFVVCTCKLLTAKLGGLKKGLGQKDISLGDLCEYHLNLYEVHVMFNKSVSRLYAVWVLDWMVNSICEIPKLLLTLFTGNASYYHFFPFQIPIKIFFSLFVSSLLARISSLQNELVRESHIASAGFGCSKRIDYKREIMGMYLLVKIAAANFRFTLCRCVFLTKSVILKFCVVVLIFVIVAMQELNK